MSTKHVSRAVCAIETTEYTRPIRARYTIGNLGEFNHESLAVTSVNESLVEMTIDLARLIDWMGRRALASKSGVSKLQGGMITAKCVGPRSVRVIRERELPIPAYAEAVTPVEA